MLLKMSDLSIPEGIDPASRANLPGLPGHSKQLLKTSRFNPIKVFDIPISSK